MGVWFLIYLWSLGRNGCPLILNCENVYKIRAIYSSVISTVGDLSRWRLSAAGVYVTRLEIQVCPALWLSPNLPLLKHFPSTLVTHQPWKHIYSAKYFQQCSRCDRRLIDTRSDKVLSARSSEVPDFRSSQLPRLHRFPDIVWSQPAEDKKVHIRSLLARSRHKTWSRS